MRSARASLGVVAVFGLLAALAPARARAEAAPPHARLVYFVDPTATGCPSPEAWRADANARAGHALFGEPSDVTIDVTIRKDPGAGGGSVYVATVGLPDLPGARAATRELRSEVGCAEVATAAALVASIALDPESILRAPPPPPPPPAPEPARAEPPRRAFVGVGPRGAWGLTPEPAVGVALSFGAISERFSLGAELAGLLPGDAPHARGSVSILPLSLSLSPCALGVAHLELCAVARLGVLRGAGTALSENFVVWKAFGAAGARVGAYADLGRLRLRASLEGVGVIPMTAFYVSETVVYTTRGVSLAGGLDALLFFR